MKVAIGLIALMTAGAVAFTIYYSPRQVEQRWRERSRHLDLSATHE